MSDNWWGISVHDSFWHGALILPERPALVKQGGEKRWKNGSREEKIENVVCYDGEQHEGEGCSYGCYSIDTTHRCYATAVLIIRPTRRAFLTGTLSMHRYFLRTNLFQNNSLYGDRS